jgi:hypothetical protein
MSKSEWLMMHDFTLHSGHQVVMVKEEELIPRISCGEEFITTKVLRNQLFGRKELRVGASCFLKVERVFGSSFLTPTSTSNHGT